MPPKEVKGREYTIYFKSPKDRENWQNYAEEVNCPLSKYILEMAILGRSKKNIPRSDIKDATLLKEEITKLRAYTSV